MGELIREQILRATREEVPHSVAVVIERVEEGEHLTRVLATILVERDTQKAILIGKQGQMLKHIGTESRLAMQKLLSGKVYLEVFIKVRDPLAPVRIDAARNSATGARTDCTVLESICRSPSYAR